MHHRQLYLTYQAQQYRLFYKQNKAIIRRKTREVCITDNCTSCTKRNNTGYFTNKKQSNHSTQDTLSMHHRQLYLMYQAQQKEVILQIKNKAIIRRKTREVCITDNCTSCIKRNNTGYFTNKTKHSFDARHAKYASQTTVPHVPSATKTGYFTNKKQSIHSTQDTRSMHHRQLYLMYQAQQKEVILQIKNKAIIRRKTCEVCITDNCTSCIKRNKKRLFYK